MLQVYKRTIGEQEIYLQADQAFEKEANTVLDFVEDSLDTITDKSIVEFHYAFVAFKPLETGFQVVVPDLAGEPDEKFTEDLSYFLSIIAQTFALAKQTKTIGQLSNFTFKDNVILTNNAFTQPEFYVHRYHEDTWFVAPVDQTIETQPLEGFQAYKVLRGHPELYPMIHLPVDYIGLYSNGQLVSVMDTDGQERLSGQ